MSHHCVESHLGISLEDYDKTIRVFVPHYDEMQAAGLGALAGLVSPSVTVLELGCGTGRFSHAILRAMPQVRLTVLDVDTKILGMARQRLAPYGERVTFLEGTFEGALPKADAVVASLSLHHVKRLEKKAQIFGNIHEALSPGGLFLNLDASVSADQRISDYTYARWVTFMHEHGVTEAEARRHLANWAEEETYFPLHDELAALTRVGFARPECFWRKGPVTVYGALKA